MSYNQYSGYGGNPYGGNESNPYGTESYGQANPYETNNTAGNAGNLDANNARPTATHQASTYSQASSNYGQSTSVTQTQTQYSSNSQPQSQSQSQSQAQHHHQQQAHITSLPGVAANAQTHPGQAPSVPVAQTTGGTMLSNQDFLSRVEAAKADIRTLTSYIGQIAAAHQRTLSSPDSGSNSALESVITQTQVLNTSIKDQIKSLETDAARSGNNSIKNSQVGQLKTSFKKQLEEYRSEEASYERRYREQIARQYRIVNPDATESEVQEAANADWGNEGVFQTALKTNRTATASTVLGAVRARHNDIQQIERTLIELNKLFEDLAEAVVIQEPMVQQAEQHTENVQKDVEGGNQHLDKGIASARRARKLKWWTFFIVLIICAILAIVLGVVFGRK